MRVCDSPQDVLYVFCSVWHSDKGKPCSFHRNYGVCLSSAVAPPLEQIWMYAYNNYFTAQCARNAIPLIWFLAEINWYHVVNISGYMLLELQENMFNASNISFIWKLNGLHGYKGLFEYYVTYLNIRVFLTRLHKYAQREFFWYSLIIL